jgi:S1-C subfamily serine protease
MVTFSFRAIAAVLIAFAVSCSTLGPSHRESSQPAYSQAIKAVLVAQETPSGEGHYIGSAFLIRVTPTDDGKYTGLFLTAKHVVDESTKTSVIFYKPEDTKQYYARVRLETIKQHPIFDAAVFEITGLPECFASPLPLTQEEPAVGDWVLSFGYSGPQKPEAHTGYLTGSAWLTRLGPCLISSAKVINGMSGGPVLNRKGEVVGITVAKGYQGEHFSISVHLLSFWLESK